MDAKPDLERIETISSRGVILCKIIRDDPAPLRTTFYTPDEAGLQVGKIVYAAGGDIPRHAHGVAPRQVADWSEVQFVRRGRVVIDIYDTEHDFVCSREAGQGDVVIFTAGGHGFHFMEDTVLIEVKQGPYAGPEDKISF